MTEFTEVKSVLNVVKSRIDAHLKFKKEYDKQLALDFSFFHFFPIGEIKISQVLAYFLDINQNHGQGNVFLNEFIKTFYDKEIEINQVENSCEKVIAENRRIDIYIRIEGLTIGIENKIWAEDQINQLKDYSAFLEKESSGNFLLLYLTPYGLEPHPKSINEKLKKRLVEENKLKFISYKHDIIILINRWLVVCEAENVSHFLKEFKKHLEIKFLGKNILNMSQELRTIIQENRTEVEQLVNEYKSIEREIENKINIIGSVLNKSTDELHIELDAEINKIGPKHWDGFRYYKWSISKNGKIISIQYIRKDIRLCFEYSLLMEEDAKLIFDEILIELNFKKIMEVDFTKSESVLAEIFLKQVKIANESFTIYEKRINSDIYPLSNIL